MQTDEMRERMFTMRLSKDESERLDALAEHYGLNGVGLIRMLLKEKARELGFEGRATGLPQPLFPPAEAPKKPKKPAK